jgi:hypothetical protein
MRGRLARVPYLRLITHEADDFIEDGRATIEMRNCSEAETPTCSQMCGPGSLATRVRILVTEVREFEMSACVAGLCLSDLLLDGEDVCEAEATLATGGSNGSREVALLEPVVDGRRRRDAEHSRDCADAQQFLAAK